MVVTPDTDHGLANVSGREAHLRCRVEPALRLQAFLEESAAAAREGLFTARGLPHGMGGARWGANFLERYRGETVFLSPPQPVQRALIALLARDSSPRWTSCGAALTHRTIRPRWSGYLSILALKKPAAVVSQVDLSRATPHSLSRVLEGCASFLGG